MGTKLQPGVEKKAPEEGPFKMRLRFPLERIGGVCRAQVVEPAGGSKFEDLKGELGWREDEVRRWKSVGAR